MCVFPGVPSPSNFSNALICYTLRSEPPTYYFSPPPDFGVISFSFYHVFREDVVRFFLLFLFQPFLQWEDERRRSVEESSLSSLLFPMGHYSWLPISPRYFSPPSSDRPQSLGRFLPLLSVFFTLPLKLCKTFPSFYKFFTPM